MKETDRIVVAGDGLEVAWHGPPPHRAPTLVFLHEGLGCVSTWREVPARLAADTGCGALVYSRKGYGRSDAVQLPRPIDYMQQEGRHALPALLAETKVQDAILIGHSDGGSIAIVYAGLAHAAPRLHGLVLEAPHVFCEALSVRSIAEARRNFVEGDLRERLRRHHGDNVDGAFWGWNGAWLDPRFADWNIEEFLSRIAVPILVVQGEADPYGTLRQVEAIVAGARAPVEQLLLPGCGHAPHRERPQETHAAMVRFIRGRLSMRQGARQT